MRAPHMIQELDLDYRHHGPTVPVHIFSRKYNQCLFSLISYFVNVYRNVLLGNDLLNGSKKKLRVNRHNMGSLPLQSINRTVLVLYNLEFLSPETGISHWERKCILYSMWNINESIVYGTINSVMLPMGIRGYLLPC